MVKHEEKYCPRCSALFECKVGSIDLCQCRGVCLNDTERSYIAEKFQDCLCANCMQQLKEDFQNTTQKT